MGIFKKTLFTMALAFSAAWAFSETSTFAGEFVSRTWTSSDGLPGNSITDLLQTKDGYLYIGSYDGLVRFDGIEFLVLNKSSDKKYPFVSARAIFQDSKENLWVGANDEGVSCIKKDGSIIHFNTDNGLTNNSVRSIAEDGNGTIWIGTASGVAAIKDEKVFIPEGIDRLDGKNSMLVLQVFCDSNNRVWICCLDSPGLIVYDQKDFKIFDELKNAEKRQISCVYEDEDKNLWFGAAPHSIIKFDGENEKVFDVGHGNQSGTNISCILQDSHKELWIARDSGITVMKDGQFEYFDQNSGLSDEKISKLIEDREGNIWIATDRGGIQKIGRAKFKTIPLSTTINAIAEDKFRNVMWFAGDSGLVCWKDGKSVENEITEKTKNIRIRDVYVNENGDLFVSCYEKLGQLKIDCNGNITSWTKDNGMLPGNKVRVSLEASNKDLYIGTTTGLAVISGKDGTVSHITKDSGLQNDYIMSLFEDSEGRIWCGTDGGGIFILKDGKIDSLYTTDDGLAGNVVFKICSFGDDAVWICTGTGASMFRNGNFFNYNASNGMGSDSVFQMIPDYTGTVWCTTNKGIYTVQKNELYDLEQRKISRLSSKFFGKSDGIITAGVTSTSRSISDSMGKIWFTLTDGVTCYDTLAAEKNARLPIVHIQEVTLDNNKIDFSNGKIEIPPEGKRLSIKFTALSFISPEQLQFRCRLNGFDSDYSQWSTERTVSYTNLKPGNYSFSVMAQTNEGIEGTLDYELKIVKKPALWQRPAFWIALVLVVAAIAFIAARRRIAKFKEEALRTQKLYKEITKTLASTIDAKDPYTKGHSARVAEYSVRIAAMMGKPKDYQDNIFMQAILHDIGKIGVPDAIISKPGRLTDEEFEIIRQHPVIGSNILKSITSMKDIGTGARWHHERYDGKGYPDKLKGADIPEIARIICVADAYDAMTSDRSYRKLLPQEKVREQILLGKGTQFDPEIADKMIQIIDEDTLYLMHG